MLITLEDHVLKDPNAAPAILGYPSRPRFNLFVGSYISVPAPSSAPGVDAIKSKVAEELLAGLSDDAALKTDVERCLLGEGDESLRFANMPFESLWERISNIAGVAFVHRALRRMYYDLPFNHNHLAVAQLLRDGHVKALFTTNYDQCIEAALGHLGFSCEYEWPRRSEPVVSVAIRPHAGSRQPLDVSFLKLHGTVNEPDSLAFMFAQITSAFSPRTLRRLRNTLCESGCPTFFCGYGFNDWDLRGLFTSRIQCVIASKPDSNPRYPRAFPPEQETHDFSFDEGDLLSTNSLLTKLAKVGSVFTANGRVLNPIFAELDKATRIEILGEILAGLSLEIGERVFDRVIELGVGPGKGKPSPRIRAVQCSGHGDKLRHALGRAAILRRSKDLQLVERSWIDGQLFLMLGLAGRLKETIGPALWSAVWLLFWAPYVVVSEAASWLRGVRRQTTVLEMYFDLAHFFPHHMLRFLILVIDAAARSRGLRAVAWMSVCAIAWLLLWPTSGILLLWSYWLMRRLGTLSTYGHQNREMGHLWLLGGCTKKAEKKLTEALRAYEWSYLHQVLVNAQRSLGWVHLRRKRDEEARIWFQKSIDVAREYKGPEGEMDLDELKGWLELRRLEVLHDNGNGWRFDHARVLAVMEQCRERGKFDVEHLRRLHATFEKPPTHRWPIPSV
jgi:hypothetical protein